jgi:hypothetical protein
VMNASTRVSASSQIATLSFARSVTKPSCSPRLL